MKSAMRAFVQLLIAAALLLQASMLTLTQPAPPTARSALLSAGPAIASQAAHVTPNHAEAAGGRLAGIVESIRALLLPTVRQILEAFSLCLRLLAVADLADLDLHRHPHLDVVTRAWRLRENVTTYDAMYVALAEALDAPLVTCDTPLANAPRHRARIEEIE